MSHTPMFWLLWFVSIVALATPYDDLLIVIFVLSEHGDVFFDIVILILKPLEPLNNYLYGVYPLPRTYGIDK
jgi:hypothetical protein